MKTLVDEKAEQLDDEGGGPSVEPEPEFHEISDAEYAFMVQKQNDLLMMGWAIQSVKKSFYQGTVPGRVKHRRRVVGKAARLARRLNRRPKRRTGVARTKHAH